MEGRVNEIVVVDSSEIRLFKVREIIKRDNKGKDLIIHDVLRVSSEDTTMIRYNHSRQVSEDALDLLLEMYIGDGNEEDVFFLIHVTKEDTFVEEFLKRNKDIAKRCFLYTMDQDFPEKFKGYDVLRLSDV